MRLGIDLDGVVADFNAGWTERYNRVFEAEVHHSQVVSWDGLVPLTHFSDMDEFWVWARGGTPEETASIFRDLPVYEGALPALETLARDHAIVIVSSKYDWAIPDTLEWIAEHRIVTREIHFVWDKTSVACDVYLEDAPHNLEALVAARPEATVCRFVRPWNEPVPGAVDVDGWAAFVELVRSLPSPDLEHRGTTG